MDDSKVITDNEDFSLKSSQTTPFAKTTSPQVTRRLGEPSAKAFGLEICLSEIPDEICDGLRLILQVRQGGIFTKLFGDQSVVKTDKSIEFKRITPTQHKKKNLFFFNPS